MWMCQCGDVMWLLVMLMQLCTYGLMLKPFMVVCLFDYLSGFRT
jgi:hypothetical protein